MHILAHIGFFPLSYFDREQSIGKLRRFDLVAGPFIEVFRAYSQNACISEGMAYFGHTRCLYRGFPQYAPV